MQASNLEYYLKKRKEEKEYREDLKELIHYASTELGITTNIMMIIASNIFTHEILIVVTPSSVLAYSIMSFKSSWYSLSSLRFFK